MSNENDRGTLHASVRALRRGNVRVPRRGNVRVLRRASDRDRSTFAPGASSCLCRPEIQIVRFFLLKIYLEYFSYKNFIIFFLKKKNFM